MNPVPLKVEISLNEGNRICIRYFFQKLLMFASIEECHEMHSSALSFPKLNADNWRQWKYHMKMLLKPLWVY